MRKNKHAGTIGTILLILLLIALVVLSNVNRDNLSFAEGVSVSIIRPAQNAFTNFSSVL